MPVILVVVLIAVVAVVAAGLLVVRAARKLPTAPRVDPFAVGEPWRRHVQDALRARKRFADAIASGQPGPLRDRLVEIGQRVDAGVEEVWRVANRGDALDDARRQIDAPGAERKLGGLEADPNSPAEPVVEALHARIASAQRMEAVIVDARSRLQLLTARLDEAVARALELSVGAGDTAELAGVGDEVDHLVDDMEALRQALEAVQGSGDTGQTALG